MLRVVAPHQLRFNHRRRQPQRLLNADFVLQPRWCLSLADNAPSLPLVQCLVFPQFRSAQGSTSFDKFYDQRCRGLLSACRRGDGGSSSLPFRRWLDVVNKPVVILSEDAQHERGMTFVGPSWRVIPDQQDLWTSCLFALSNAGQLHISAILVKMSIASPGAVGCRKILLVASYKDRIPTSSNPLSTTPIFL